MNSGAERASTELLWNADIEHAAFERKLAGGSLSALTNRGKHAWNAVFGALKKLETPERMAQRIVGQLKAAKPVYTLKAGSSGLDRPA